MGQLVLGVAGGIIGNMIAPGIGGYIGYAIGSSIGSVLFPQKVQGQQQSLIDLKIVGTDYGQCIPYIRGAAPTAGQYWWNTDRRPTITTTTTGGKGGEPEVTSSVTTYDMDALIGLSDNVIYGIARIWDNGKLIWTNLSGASASSLSASALTGHWDRMTVYTGADDQMPDPTYEAAVGTADAPAYRGRGSVFIQGLKLGESGSPRNLVFEVVADGTIGGVPSPRYETLGAIPAVPYPIAPRSPCVDPNTKWVWTLDYQAWYATSFGVTVISDVGKQVIVSLSEVCISAYPLGVTYVGTGEVWVLLLPWIGLSRYPLIARFSAGTANTDGTAATVPAFIGFDYLSDGLIDPEMIAYDPVGGKVWISCGVNNLAHAGMMVVDPITRTTFQTISTGLQIGYPRIITCGNPYIALYGDAGPGVQDFLIFDANLYVLLHTLDLNNSVLIGDPVAYDSVREQFIVIASSGNDYKVVDAATGAITTKTLTLAADADTSPPPRPLVSAGMDAVAYHAGIDRIVFGCDGSATYGTALHVVNPDSFITEHSYTYETGSIELLINPLLVPVIGAVAANYVLVYDSTTLKRYYFADNTIAIQAPTVANVVSALCLRAGLTAGQIDVTPLASITRTVRCFPISQITSTRRPLELLMSAYFFEMTVSDKVKFVPRGGSAALTIPYADLGSSTDRSQPDQLALKRASDLEQPAQIALTYMNVNDDYQNDTQYSDRLISVNSGTVTALQMSMGMTPSEAKSVVDTTLLDLVASSVSTTIEVLSDYTKLEPTDAVIATDANGGLFRFRFVRKTDSFPLQQFEAVLDDVSVLISMGITSADYTSSTVVTAPVDTSMVLLDIAILRDVDNDVGFYVATKGSGTPYAGAGVYNSTDNVEYTRQALVLESAIFGTCTSTLGNWTGARVFDMKNSVTVNVGAVLSSSTRSAVLNSLTVNAMLIGNEMIQFLTATIVTAGIYILTGLLRGGRGTEWAMTGHTASERCVLLREAGMRRIPSSNSEIGLAEYYKGVTIGRALSTASPVVFTNTANGLKPFSPVNLRTLRDISNNIIFTWERRSRLSVRMIGTLGINVPLGEDTESYEIDVYSDGTYTTVLRTITASTPTASYSAAQQTADGLTPGNTVYARLYQLSATVGRGYPLEKAA